MPRPRSKTNLAAKLAAVTVSDRPAAFTPIAAALPYVEPAPGTVLSNAVTRQRNNKKNNRHSKTKSKNSTATKKAKRPTKKSKARKISKKRKVGKVA